MKPTLYHRTKDEWFATLAKQEYDLRTEPLYDNEGEIEDATPLPEEVIAAASFICMGMIDPAYLSTPFFFQMSRFVDMTVDVVLCANDRSILINLGSDGIASYSGHDNHNEVYTESFSSIKGASRYTGTGTELARFTTMVTAWVFAPSLSDADKAPMEASRVEQKTKDNESLNLSPFKAQRIIDILNTTTTGYHAQLKNAARHFLAQDSGYWAEREKEYEQEQRSRLLADSGVLRLSERDALKLIEELEGPPREPSPKLKAAAQKYLAQLKARQIVDE